MSKSANLASALRTLETEQNGLDALAKALQDGLGDAFDQACSTIRDIGGRVIVTGVGKSGHVGAKLAATLASTGTPAFFVHAAEANHGDLGMIARDDAIIAISWSGETTELQGILSYSRRFSIPLIAFTRNKDSALGKESDICLTLPKEKEACPNGLAPTTSTMMQMALGDALAVALLESKSFSADDFGVYHPGGSLGASLTHVSEIMHAGGKMPLVSEDTKLTDAVVEISNKGFGCVGIVDTNGTLIGMITDGDLRRNINHNMSEMAIAEIMTRDPKSINEETLATSALAVMNEKSITALFVLRDNKPVGIVHMHDFLRIGVA